MAGGSLRSALLPNPAVIHLAQGGTCRGRPEWWYRVPKALVGELGEDVERLRLIEAE